MDVERIVRTYISSDGISDDIPAELLTGVQTGSVGLLEIVKALGEYLTSTEEAVRAKGITLLSNMLVQTPPDKINRQGTQVLTSFYCDKLEDHESVPSALRGLAVLAKLSTFGAGEAKAVFRAIAGNITMKAHVQSTRHLVFILVDILLAKQLPALKSLGDEFIASYVKLAEGEKDPRNLMLAFGIARVLLIEMDPYKHLDDMFDIIYCYFPITFRPPPNDPYNITPLDLQQALRKAMSATPRFAPMAMPLFLEKLPASLGESKKDVLRGISACLPIFGDKAIESHSSDLWDSLKTEIFYSPDAEIEREALLALRTLLTTLYPSTPETKPADLALAIIKECQTELEEPEKSKAKPATKVLMTCVMSSTAVGTYALSQVLPQLFKTYHRDTDVPRRTAALVAIAELLKSLRETYVEEHTTRSYLAEHPVENFKDELLSLMSTGIESQVEEIKAAALEMAEHMAHISGFLDLEETIYSVNKINSVLINSQSTRLQHNALKVLASISKLTTKPIEEHTLPLLYGQLPEMAPDLAATDERDRIRHVLDALSVLCVQPGLFEFLLIRLLHKLETLCLSNNRDSAPDQDFIKRECQLAYGFSFLHAINITLKRKVQEKHVDVPKYFDQVVPRLYGIFIYATSRKESLACDTRLLAEAGSIIEAIVAAMPAERQQQFADNLFDAYRSGDMRNLTGKYIKDDFSSPVRPLQTGATLKEQNLSFLLMAGVVGLRPDKLPRDINVFMRELLWWTLDTSSTRLQVNMTCLAMASLLNKRTSDLASDLSTLKQDLWAECSAGDTTIGRRSKAITVWIWLSRGLLVKNHPEGLHMITKVLELFERDASTASHAATALAILADKQGDRILSKENFAVVKTLYKQRLFSTLFPLLITGSNLSLSEAQSPYLLALGSVVPIAPRGLIMSNLPQLLPLILRGLTLLDAELRYNMLQILIAVLEVQDDANTTSLIQGQARAMVDAALVAALDLCAVSSSPKTRIAALQCLGVFPDVIRYDVLHPIKVKVLRSLGSSIDDPKRAVRKEAVDCRAKWYNYGGIGV